MTVDVLLAREHHAGQEDGLQRGEGPVVAAEDGGQGHAQGLGVSTELVSSPPIDASGHLGQDDDESCNKIMQGRIIIENFLLRQEPKKCPQTISVWPALICLLLYKILFLILTL